MYQNCEIPVHSLITVLIHNSGHFGPPLPFWAPRPPALPGLPMASYATALPPQKDAWDKHWAYMRPVATDGVVWSACLSVGPFVTNREPYKYSWNDRDAVRNVDSGGPRQTCFGGWSGFPAKTGTFRGRHTGKCPDARGSIYLMWLTRAECDDAACSPPLLWPLVSVGCGTGMQHTRLLPTVWPFLHYYYRWIAGGCCFYFGELTAPSRLAWSEGWRPPVALSAFTKRTARELSQWLWSWRSTMNIIVVIIITILQYYYTKINVALCQPVNDE